MAKLCISSRYYCDLSYNSFHVGSHTDPCQFTPFFNDLLVMKIVTVSDLCLTCVILSIFDFFFIMAFGSWTTTNDPCPIHIIFDQNDGQVVGLTYYYDY